MKYTFPLIFLICFHFLSSAQEKEEVVFHLDSLYELPQIFYADGDTLVRWIEAGVKQEISKVNTSDFSEQVATLETRFKIPLAEALNYVEHRRSIGFEFEQVEKVFAISDIHGQYKAFIRLLKLHGIVDEELNWAMGKAHLVINGDILDRGSGVTEALWLTFKLQQQAEKAGGRVHYIIGNHELMVFDNDLRYINEKYKIAQDVLEETYDAQFSEQAFFGKWMRQNPITIKINDVGFVHAGISEEILQRKLDADNINVLFVDSIFTQAKDLYRKSDVFNFLARTNGPVWYRGYFKEEASSAAIDDVLKWWGVRHVVVGHTSQKFILPLFEGKVIAIDSSIKYGDRGEVLIFEDGEFFKGRWDGERESLYLPVREK